MNMNSKALPQRKDKTVPSSKNLRTHKDPYAKKDGHGKFNWGKPTDYEYMRDPQEGDDKRVLEDMYCDPSVVLVASDTTATSSSIAKAGSGLG